MKHYGGTCLTVYRSQPLPERPSTIQIQLGLNVPSGTYRTAIVTPQNTVIMYPKQSATPQSITNGVWSLDTDNLDEGELAQLLSGRGTYHFLLLDQNNTPTTFTPPTQGSTTELNAWATSFMVDYQCAEEAIGNDEIFMIPVECVC